MFFLYFSMSGFSTSTVAVVKHKTPRPICAAFSKVDGEPAATHIGGCGSRVGLRQNVALRHREEAAVVARVLLVAPHLSELDDHLVEHLARELGVVDPEPLLLGRRAAPTHPELETALREVVDHRDPLGDPRRRDSPAA